MEIRPGPLNAITDVAGIALGHAEAPEWGTGTTVILPEAPATAAVDVRGGGPGTRETDLLSGLSAVDQVHALVLSGGSALGLDAAGGVVDWLRRRGRGLPIRGAVVPLVPAAILFDLPFIADPSRATETPYRALG
ncbi:MAG: P1 family peptidase, partial [Pseudomonadota bacterium]